ncbi:rho family-interacting cell polarization regulator 1-like [Prunus avium]|uniref:Rho family-interacting cell polarization regulator 1-like n=1 Tax=Prunus avium TaxID=42229 RepID=A0A6P5RHN3_PRUAV|nr:rho family-interacting cell polarization regulator 1-like [Prunus avium]
MGVNPVACVFVGYSDQHHGYRCFHPSTGRLYISRHVVFNESKFNYASTNTPPSSPTPDIVFVPVLPLAHSLSAPIVTHVPSEVHVSVALSHPLPSSPAPIVPTTQAAHDPPDPSSPTLSTHPTESPPETLPSTTSTSNPLSSRSSPIQTRSKSGIFKPKMHSYIATKYPIPHALTALLTPDLDIVINITDISVFIHLQGAYISRHVVFNESEFYYASTNTPPSSPTPDIVFVPVLPLAHSLSAPIVTHVPSEVHVSVALSHPLPSSPAPIVPTTQAAHDPPDPSSPTLSTHPTESPPETLPSTTSTSNPLSSRSSPIQTRSKSGIFKPKMHSYIATKYPIPHALTALLTPDLEPTCYTQASRFPH